jgi:hypothetical protein
MASMHFVDYIIFEVVFVKLCVCGIKIELKFENEKSIYFKGDYKGKKGNECEDNTGEVTFTYFFFRIEI